MLTHPGAVSNLYMQLTHPNADQIVILHALEVLSAIHGNKQVSADATLNKNLIQRLKELALDGTIDQIPFALKCIKSIYGMQSGEQDGKRKSDKEDADKIFKQIMDVSTLCILLCVQSCATVDCLSLSCRCFISIFIRFNYHI